MNRVFSLFCRAR